MNGILTGSLESSEVRCSGKTIKTSSRGRISTVAFLVDGKHVVSGDEAGKIRRWRVEDGMQVGTPMDVGSWVRNIAVSRDGKWIVSGTSGLVQVWNADDGKKVTQTGGHSDWVTAVDVSPDSTKIAGGSDDNTIRVWSLSTGQKLLGPWECNGRVFSVKFSPNGRLIATATWRSVLIYDSRHGNFVLDVPIRVAHSHNHSLAWSSNGKHLFVVSPGKVICLDPFTGAMLSQWSTHGDKYNCIALASNGAFIATSFGSSVSFWDTTTHEQLGSVIEHTDIVGCMAISANDDIVIAGGWEITLRSLCSILPSSYCNTVSTFAS